MISPPPPSLPSHLLFFFRPLRPCIFVSAPYSFGVPSFILLPLLWGLSLLLLSSLASDMGCHKVFGINMGDNNQGNAITREVEAFSSMCLLFLLPPSRLRVYNLMPAQVITAEPEATWWNFRHAPCFRETMMYSVSIATFFGLMDARKRKSAIDIGNKTVAVFVVTALGTWFSSAASSPCAVLPCLLLAAACCDACRRGLTGRLQGALPVAGAQKMETLGPQNSEKTEGA
ncbi:hypothetical protein GUITHDRAFT_138132 [Guillardia theta CCMP2712]|uniref:Uncharacterized protein n=1 Tax=Guillardia theta (strain CCMP2712) TaxID=905079 RepID=L1JE53_GUITC|nr:hypothetical protein GUITHDRAFT_138132 [Guillardia theta CCMP2712]EKX46793.1 hypothetical protein GUITHDRAFT_138132 [Guillardia theta CCMP2712]|eukprot:XP_005833773.1 hypothetical protein GUITHDRAFT_138132 [Guillardia theta CCMP2712]